METKKKSSGKSAKAQSQKNTGKTRKKAGQTRKGTKKEKKSGSGALSWVLMIFLIVLCGGLLIVAVWRGSGAVSEAYQQKKEEVTEEVYQSFYQRSYDTAEKAHHVSSQVTVSIGTLQEESRLEVLQVSNVAYEIREGESENFLSVILDRIRDQDVSSWMKVPGNGVFTVNLRTAEFLIDDEREYLLIRLPEPELTEFTIDYANVEELYFDDSGAFKNSAKVGVDLAREQLESAELDLREEITSNQRFYQSAREAAQEILISLVRELNPGLPDLEVEVEFMD